MSRSSGVSSARSMVRIAAATRRMFTPTGDTDATRTGTSAREPASSSDAHDGMRVLRMPKPVFSRSTAISVMLVDWPLSCSSTAAFITVLSASASRAASPSRGSDIRLHRRRGKCFHRSARQVTCPDASPPSRNVVPSAPSMTHSYSAWSRRAYAGNTCVTRVVRSDGCLRGQTHGLMTVRSVGFAWQTPPRGMSRCWRRDAAGLVITRRRCTKPPACPAFLAIGQILCRSA
jgi:hypothetical protein